MDKKDFIEWARKLQQSYFPSVEVKSKLSKVDLLAIVGPTGVGKTTLINQLKIPSVLSDVTRNLREGEKNNQNYHFREDYLDILKEIKTGEFAQFLVSDTGEFYGTHVNAHPDEGWCTMAIFATAIPNFRKLGFRKVVPVYIMPPGYVEWMRRIGELRAGDLDVRIAESITSIKTALADSTYRFVLNDNMDLALNDINAIMNGGRVDEHRARLAKESADILLERLGDQDDSMYFSNSAQ
jgi:guanylate kinase